MGEASPAGKATLAALTVLGLLLKVEHLLPFRLEVRGGGAPGAPGRRACACRRRPAPARSFA
jgi:hypothetical protein